MPQYQLEAASHTHAVPLYFYSLDDTFAGTQQPNVSLLFALSRVTTKSLLALLRTISLKAAQSYTVFGAVPQFFITGNRKKGWESVANPSS